MCKWWLLLKYVTIVLRIDYLLSLRAQHTATIRTHYHNISFRAFHLLQQERHANALQLLMPVSD